MLQASNRLRKSADINRVYKRGVYGSGLGQLSVKVAPGTSPYIRFVVVVGKKVDKRAVIRNKIRRRIIGDIQSSWATLPAGYDIVISVHRDLSRLEPAQLHHLLVSALGHARITIT